jgi:hypothetical protein
VLMLRPVLSSALQIPLHFVTPSPYAGGRDEIEGDLSLTGQSLPVSDPYRDFAAWSAAT